MNTKMMSLALGMLSLIATGAEARSMRRYEDFTMTRTPGAIVNPSCATVTNLQIDYMENTATLEERVIGLCDIVVRPNTRTYKLDAGRGNANGTTYYGVRARNGDELVLRDYRNAVIPVRSPSRITASETVRRTGRVNMLYSADGRIHR